MLNDSSWHGVATLMYTPLKRGVTGSHVDVSENLHEPQNTLALLQYPSYPIANVTRFIGGIYTVDEDEEDSGFMVRISFIKGSKMGGCFLEKLHIYGLIWYCKLGAYSSL